MRAASATGILQWCRELDAAKLDIERIEREIESHKSIIGDSSSAYNTISHLIAYI